MREELYFKTDTLPEEIPILFTNRNLFYNFKKKNIGEWGKDKNLNQLSSLSIIPYYFYIPKKDNTNRRMSLLHPISQILMFNYILKYEQLICSFADESEFSVRSPINRNIPVFKESDRKKLLYKLDQEFSFSKDTHITSEEHLESFYSYFSYKPFSRITDLYQSPKFIRAKHKYKYFLKLDIQNFFPSIYTHSLSWGIFGEKSLAKKYKGEKNLFGNATDLICQKINFNETNGIVVGPEFSRIISELLLTSIDKKVYSLLEEKELYLKENYLIFRFLDDYFLFTNTKEDALNIEHTIEIVLDKFNLKLNSSKRNIQEKPFDIVNHGIVELKNAFTIFQYNNAICDKDYEVYKNNRYRLVDSENIEDMEFFYGKRNTVWTDLYNNIELIIINNPYEKSTLVKYYLKRIRSLLPSNNIHIYNLLNIIEINSNIYSLSINTGSTESIILIYTKIIQKHKKRIYSLTKKKVAVIDELTATNTTLEDTDEKLIKKIENEILALNEYMEKINEKIYQNSYFLLKTNLDNLDEMYELIVFLKSLDSKLPSTFLIKIIKKYNKNYFILCSVAYYILNQTHDGIDNPYKTVIKILWSTINEYDESYISKGTKTKILDAEYFYIMNDFSHYPGFPTDKQTKIKREIEKSYKELGGNYEDIFKKITQSSYYDWKKEIKDFLREVAKKSIISNKVKKANYN